MRIKLRAFFEFLTWVSYVKLKKLVVHLGEMKFTQLWWKSLKLNVMTPGLCYTKIYAGSYSWCTLEIGLQKLF